MLISIKMAGELSKEALAERLNSLGFPALLLDGDLKVIAKNTESLEFASKIRIGSKINRYLSEEGAVSVTDMQPGETRTERFTSEKLSCRVSVVCGNECRLFIFRPVGGGLRKGIYDKYRKMSGYDVIVSEPEITPHEFKAGTGRENLAEIINRLLETHTATRRLPFFNVFDALMLIKGEIERYAPELAKRISVSYNGKKLFAEGSERDFALISIFVAAFCCDVSVDSRVYIEADALENELMLRVFCEGMHTADSDSLHISESPLEEYGFWAHLIKLLADGNLWDFKAQINHRDKSEFVLRMPAVAAGEEFYIRDISTEFVRALVSAFFERA